MGRGRNARVQLAGKPPPGVGGGASCVPQVIQVYADGWHETLTAVVDTGHAVGSWVTSGAKFSR